MSGKDSDPNALIMGVAALLATFYCALISTELAGSVTEKLAAHTTVEGQYRALIRQGLLALQSGEPPRGMEERLRTAVWKSSWPSLGWNKELPEKNGNSMRSFAARVSKPPASPKKRKRPVPAGAGRKFLQGLCLAVLVG